MAARIHSAGVPARRARDRVAGIGAAMHAIMIGEFGGHTRGKLVLIVDDDLAATLKV